MVEKFTGTGFTANALNLDFLRDGQGNPINTPNSFLVLHNPVRQKCNEIIDQINNILSGEEIVDVLKAGSIASDNYESNTGFSLILNSKNHNYGIIVKPEEETINQTATILANLPDVGVIYSYNYSQSRYANIRFGKNQTNVGLYFDQANNRFGINNDNPQTTLDIAGFLNTSLGIKVGLNDVITANRDILANAATFTGNTIVNAAPNENFLIARMSSVVADQGGLVIDQNSTYRARLTVQGSGSSGGNVNIKYEKASDKSLGTGILNFLGFANLYLSGNKLWHAGNDGAGSGLDADTIDTIDSTELVTKKSYSTTNVTAGTWYRIAKNGPVSDGGTGGSRAGGKFTLTFEASGSYHQYISFMATVQYNENPSLVLLSNSHYFSYYGITKIRLVHGETYEGTAVEVYVENPGISRTAKFELTDNLSISGWEPVNWEVGSVPSGFTTTEIDISANNALMSLSSSGINIFELSHGGSLKLGKLGGGNYNALILYRSTAGTNDYQSLLFKSSTLECAAIKAQVLNSNDADLVFFTNTAGTTNLLEALRITHDKHLDLAGKLKLGGVDVIDTSRNITGVNGTFTGNTFNIGQNSGLPILSLLAASGSSSSFYLKENSSIVGILQYVAATDVLQVVNYEGGLTNSSLQLYKTGLLKLTSTNGQNIDLSAASYVNFSSGGLKILGVEVISSARKGIFEGLINAGTRRSGTISTDYFFEDVVHYSSNSASIVGTLIIQTSIPYAQNEMTRIKIDGYNFVDKDCVIDLTIGGYAYSSNQLLRQGYINNGSKRYLIRSAKQTSTGNLAILIGDITEDFKYPKVKVSSLILGYFSDPVRAEGWTISITDDLSSYDSIQTLTEGSGYVIKNSDADLNTLKIAGLSLVDVNKNIFAKKGIFTDDLVVNKPTGNPAIQFQSNGTNKFQIFQDLTNNYCYWQNDTSFAYFALYDNGELLLASKLTKDIKLNPAGNVNLITGGLAINGVLAIDSNRHHLIGTSAPASKQNGHLWIEGADLHWKSGAGTEYKVTGTAV